MFFLFGGGMDWIDLAQDRNRSVVNAVMNHVFHKSQGIS